MFFLVYIKCYKEVIDVLLIGRKMEVFKRVVIYSWLFCGYTVKFRLNLVLFEF